MEKQNVALPRESQLVREAEYIYDIREPDLVSMKIRHIYKTIGLDFPQTNTSIFHTFVGRVDQQSCNYRDSDGKSKNEDPIKTKSGEEAKFVYTTEKGTGYLTKYGIPDLKTDLKENDIYWIEMEADLKDLVKKEGNSFRLPLLFTSEGKNHVIFQVRIPFASEGIIMHKQTIIKSVLPSPSSVYDEIDCKVFQWILGNRSPGEKDSFEVLYTVKTSLSPLVKYFVSGFVGAMIGALIGAVIQ